MACKSSLVPAWSLPPAAGPLGCQGHWREGRRVGGGSRQHRGEAGLPGAVMPFWSRRRDRVSSIGIRAGRAGPCTHLPTVVQGPRPDLKLQVSFNVVGGLGDVPGYVASVAPLLGDLEGVRGHQAYWRGGERGEQAWRMLDHDAERAEPTHAPTSTSAPAVPPSWVPSAPPPPSPASCSSEHYHHLTYEIPISGSSFSVSLTKPGAC